MLEAGFSGARVAFIPPEILIATRNNIENGLDSLPQAPGSDLESSTSQIATLVAPPSALDLGKEPKGSDE